MKNIFAMLFGVLLLCGTAAAQDITLYEMTSRTLDIAEAIATCAGQDGACTEEDIAALQADMANTRQELFGSLIAGRLAGLTLTLEEGEALQARAKDLQGRFAHIALFDGICNRGVALASGALSFLQSALTTWINGVKGIFAGPTPFLFNVALSALFTVILAIVAVADIAFGLLSLPALSACLLWWL